MIDFNNVMHRNENGSLKWDQKYIDSRFGKITTAKIYPLFIADMDYVIDTTITEKFQEIISLGDYGYFNIQKDYFESIQAWYQQEHNLTISQTEIVPAPGTLSAIHFLMSALSKNKPTLIFTPGYGHFVSAITPFAPLHTMKLQTTEQQYFIDMQLLEKTILEQNIQTLVFCNPHNPSGRNWTKTELQELVTVCQRHQVLIISDEIHGDLTLGQQPFTSLYAFTDSYENIVITTSGNKLFNMSGLATSFILTKNQKLATAFITELDNYHTHPNRLGVAYATIAYKYGADWKKALQQEIISNITLAQQLLTSAKLTIWQPDSGYLLWLELKHIDNIDTFVQKLAQQTGVLVETGSRFIEGSTTFIRINVATKKSLLKEALILLNDFIETY